MSTWLVAGFWMSMLLTSTPPADEPEVGPLALSRAQVLHQRGTQAFRRGEVREALQLFESAHEVDPRPELLINIAQCHRALGKRAEAVGALEQFLSQVPPSHALAPAVRGTLDELRRERAHDPPPDAPLVKPNLEPTSRPQPTAPLAGKVTAGATPGPSWPLVLIAGGALVVGGGLLLYLQSRAQSGEGGGSPVLATVRLPAPD